MNLIQSAIAKVKNLANTYINNVAKPMAIGVPQAQDYLQKNIQPQAIKSFSNLQQFGKTFAEKSGQYATQQVAQNPVNIFRPNLARDFLAKKLVPMAAEIPGRVIESWGRGGGYISEPTKSLNIAKSNPISVESFINPDRPSGASMALDVVSPGFDVGDLARAGGIVGGVALSRKIAVNEARALKPFLPEIQNVLKMIGENLNEIPNLSQQQLAAAEAAVSKVRGPNAIKEFRRLNANAQDYYNSLRSVLVAAREQILNPQANIGFSVKNIRGNQPNVPQQPVYDVQTMKVYSNDPKTLDIAKQKMAERGDTIISTSKIVDNRGEPVVNIKYQSQQPLSVQSTKGVESMPQVTKTQELPKVGQDILPEMKVPQSKPLLSQTPQKLYKDMSKQEQALEDIISQGRKQIGGKIEEPKTSFKQSMDNLYTQWVDRYNPIVKASKKAKEALKTKGASLRPEFDPEYLVRRLTGAGGIADYKFRTELNPIIKEVEKSGIPKLDLDTYLVNKRIAGFGSVGRDIYGADPVKAGEITMALDQKYGPELGKYADELYKYQDKGFQEMIDAGFISPENAQIIKTQNPDYSPLYRVMDDVDEYLGLPTRKTMQGSQPIQKIKGSKRQIESPVESIIGNTFRQRAAIEKNRVAKSIVSLNETAPELGFKKVSKSAEDTITVWNNGQKEFFQVGKDIADVAKGANEEAMNLVLKVLQAPAALLRQGATGRNPEFMIPNIVRDQLDAGITSKYGYIPFVDYVSGLKSMITKDDIYQKWSNSGAKIDLGEMSGKKSIKQLFETAKSREGLFKKLGKVLDVMGKYSEQPTRIGLFKKAYKKTGNEMLAMLESRDATVDFARMGTKMKVANSIVPFLNVGIQGFDKLIRATKNNPMKVLFNASLYGLAPAATLTVYNLKNYPQEYFEIPQYEKDNNFVVVLGRNEDGTVDYATFPKGNIIPVVANPVESFINYSFGNDQESFGELALQVLGSVLPVVSEGRSMGEIGLKTIGSNLPQAFKPIAENLTNKSFYKYDTKKEQSKEIVPYFLQDEPDYKQTYKFTPKLYQAIGAVTDTSPLKVQNLLEGYLAGYIKIPAQIVEMAVKMSNNKEVSPNEKTILRRFIKQTYPTSKKKLEVKKETPGLMERVTGEIKAAEKIAVSAITEEEKDALVSQFKESGKTSEVVGDRLYYRTDTGTGSVSMNFEVETPKYTGNTLIDNELKADYKGEITKAKNAVMKAFEMGAIDQKKAMEELSKLKVKTTGTKKPKKLKIKSPKFVPIKIGKTKKITGLTKKKKFKLIRAKKLKGVKL